MLALISPAKKLDGLETAPTGEFSQPALMGETGELIRQVAKLGHADIRRLMKVSAKIADVAVARHRQLVTELSPANGKQAVYAFRGDTYVGLDAASLGADDMRFAQDRLRILSGLYGLLRPLDVIQPYRLEMGTKLPNPRGEDLYDFWGARIAGEINKALEKAGGGPVVNLASKEYFSAAREDLLDVPVVTPVFKEGKNGAYRVLGLFAKRARGMMARYIIENRIEEADGLKRFNAGGYEFNPGASTGTEFVFLRDQP